MDCVAVGVSPAGPRFWPAALIWGPPTCPVH